MLTRMESICTHQDTSTLLPMWIAPNLITLAGLLCQVTATLLMLYYVPDLRGRAPAWVYLSNSVSVFAYQTLDGLDGKQARRTGSSSPLGQLFDHGCDALSVPLLMICAAGAANLGSGVRPMVAQALVMLPWVIGNWEEYHTGVLNVGNGWIGVTEGQFGLVILHLISAWRGPDIWQTPTRLLGILPTPYPVVDIIMVGFAVVSIIGTGFEIMKVMVMKCPLGKEDVGNKEIEKVDAIAHLTPFLSIIVMGLLWSAYGSSNIHPFLLLSSIGALFAWNALEMVVAHCAKEPFIPSYWPHFLLAACAFNSCYLGLYTELVEYLVMSLMIFFYLRFVFGVVNQLTSYLNIKCLTIPST